MKKANKFYSFKAECEKHSLQGNDKGGGVLDPMEKLCKRTKQKWDIDSVAVTGFNL